MGRRAVAVNADQLVVDRALRFAYSFVGDRDAARRVVSDCKIVWPRLDYSLRPGRYGTIELHRAPRRPRRRNAVTTASDLEELKRSQKRLRTGLTAVLNLRDGREGWAIFPSVTQMRVISDMCSPSDQRLPADVLSGFALALLADERGPYFQFVRRCRFCEQVFVPPKPKRGGQRVNFCHTSDCKKKYDRQYHANYPPAHSR